MRQMLLVGLGGFVGSVARYGISALLVPLAPGGFPWGTLLVNLSGSFAIGVVLAAAVERAWLAPDVRLLLAAGLCGGFTTMSSFSFETWALLEQGLFGLAAGYVTVTLLGCLIATWSGIALIRLM